MCEICKPLHELPWRFLRRMLHVLRHDEWHWHWQKAATLYNNNNNNNNNNKDVIGIRATYYIFCCRNKNWDSADNEILIFESFNLKQPIVNYLYLARFTIVHLKKTNKVSIVISGAPLARASAAPKLRKSMHPKNFGNHVTVHWPTTACRPSVRTTGKSMFYLASSS